jgi:ACDE family multidrug resistance protein
MGEAGAEGSGNRDRRPWYPLGRAESSGERLALSAALGSFGVLGFSLTAPILPDLQAALAISESAVGWVQGAIALPGIVVSVVIGYLADRYGRRRAALSSLIVFGLFGYACSWSPSFETLIAFRFLQGIGMSGILGFGIVLVGDYFEGSRRTRAMGVNQAAMLVTAMLGPVVGGLLAAGGHPFRPFLIFLAGVPLAVWACRLPEMTPVAAESPLGHSRALVRLLRVQGSLVDYLGMLAVTLVVIAVGIGLALTIVPLFLDSAFGVPVAYRGLIVAAYQAGSVPAALGAGAVAARWGSARGITLGLLALGIGMGVAAAAAGPAMVAGGLALAGVGFGLFVTLAQTYVSSVGTGEQRGLAAGVWLSINRLAQAAAPPLGTAMSHRTGARAVLFAGSGAVVVAGATWRWLRAELNRHLARR